MILIFLNLRNSVILVLMGVLSISCKQQFNSKTIESSKKDIGLQGREVNINYESLKPYDPFHKEEMSSSKSRFTIVSYLNASCSSCLAEINEWKSFFESSFEDSKLRIQLIFYSDDNFEYLKFLCESKKIEAFPFLFYLDNDGKFANENRFFIRDDIENTILLDERNKVLLTGNPLLSQSKKQEYINIIAGT